MLSTGTEGRWGIYFGNYIFNKVKAPPFNLVETELKNEVKLRIPQSTAHNCQEMSLNNRLFISNLTLHPYDMHTVLLQQRPKSLPTNGLCHLHNSNGFSNLAAVV